MKKNKGKLLTLAVLASGIFLVGCKSDENFTNIEKAVHTLLPKEEIVKIVETDSDKKNKDKILKDVEISLNLENLSKSIAYEKSLQKITYVLGMLDSMLDEEINNYVFKVNSSKLDVYGNKQKVKVLEVSIDKNTVDKINFEHFDYLNLDKICKVTKFKYLTEADEKQQGE